MFRALAQLFHTRSVPKRPFWDPVLGEFAFDPNLGWKKRILLDGRDAELVLGSDGDPPRAAMLETARSWVAAWPDERPKIIAYIRSELRKSDWSEEPDLPDPDKFQVEAIHLLWENTPRTSMIYFHYPGDDIRFWHVTLDGFELRGFAYDD